jgi:hypothetical protein
MPIPNIPPALEYLPDEKTPLKTFGVMLNKLWQKLFVVLSPIFNASIVYTPVITAGSGTFTTVSASGRYTVFGKYVLIQITVTITTNGTAAGQVTATLPFSSVNVAGVEHVLAGRAQAISGKMLQGAIGPNASAVGIVNYDNSYPGASGETLVLSGFYEYGG